MDAKYTNEMPEGEMSMQDFSSSGISDQQPTDYNTNGENKSSSLHKGHGVPLQGRRSRIRFHPYKGIGSRTYKNTVFVSNIPYELSEKEFKDLFENEVGTVSFCEIFPEKGGLSTGCGSIEFENADDVMKAIIHMKKYEIQGRKLVVRDDRNLSYSSRYRPPPEIKPVQPSLANSEVLMRLAIHPDEVSETVHVAQLAEEVDLRKLKDVFSLAGVVMNLDILKDEQGSSLGLGTVTFSSTDEAINAISMFDNKPLFEKKMSVRMDKTKRRGADSSTTSELPSGLGEIGTNLLTGPRPSRGAGGLNPMTGMPMGAGGNVGMGMFGGRMGDMGGYGYGMGMDMTGYSDYYQTDMRGGYGGGPMRGYDHNSYGSSSGGGGGSGVGTGGDMSCEVFVRNLSEDTTWEDLKDEFKKVGHVNFADVKKDAEGRSRCIGTVKFFNAQDAQQAIMLKNGAFIKGRRIGVTVCRY